MKHIEEPKVVERDRGETVTMHPAFAQIGASRVSGNTYLYGSDFRHQHYVTVTICRSEQHRNLSRDWEFGREELIEVALSEAQWATFVSTPNVGSGVPCTLERFDGQMIPGLPNPTATDEKFRQEIEASMARMQADLRKLAADLDGPLSKTKAAELRKNMEWIAGRMTDSTGFVAKQFGEHIEHTVEKAKIEVNAYATNMIQRAGLEALAGGLPAIEYKQDK